MFKLTLTLLFTLLSWQGYAQQGNHARHERSGFTELCFEQQLTGVSPTQAEAALSTIHAYNNTLHGNDARFDQDYHCAFFSLLVDDLLHDNVPYARATLEALYKLEDVEVYWDEVLQVFGRHSSPINVRLTDFFFANGYKGRIFFMGYSNDWLEYLLEIVSPQGETFTHEGHRLFIEAANYGESELTPAIRDLTGNGLPDLVLLNYSGGAHCCHEYTIFELGEELRVLFHEDMSHSPLWIEDMNGDGIMELRAVDASFAYAFCSFAGSPMPPLVFGTAEDETYHLMNLHFRHDSAIQSFFENTIEDYRQHVGTPDMAYADACWYQGLVYNYIYAGRAEEGWALFDEIYPHDDKEEFRQDLEGMLEYSPWYVQLKEP